MPAFDFAGATSLVTGASSGLGEQFARQLAARGSGLVLVARSADRLAALADELRARHGVTVTTVPADLSRADEVSRVAAHAAATQVDVLVNNAGFGTYGTFAGLDPGRGRYHRRQQERHDLRGQCAQQHGVRAWPLHQMSLPIGRPPQPGPAGAPPVRWAGARVEQQRWGTDLP